MVMVVVMMMMLGGRCHGVLFELTQNETQKIWHVREVPPARPVADAFNPH
jgi:hypothetical protein